MGIKGRVEKLNKRLAPPGPSPVVIIEPGEYVSPRAQVVIIDDIPRHGKITLPSGRTRERQI